MASFQEALKVLRASRVKKGDSPESAARHDRLNAMIDAILGLARGENIGRGKGVRKRTGPDGFILTGDASGEDGGGGGSGGYAFEVTESVKDDYTAIAVAPGFILNQVPYIDGELMTTLVFDGTGTQVQNTLTPPATPTDMEFSVWLITRIKLDSPNYHPRIDIDLTLTPSGVLPAAQSCYLTCDAPAPDDAIDFRVKWDNPVTKVAGGFPIRIATVKLELPPEGATSGPVVLWIRQHVFSSWRALILAGNDIIPIS